jgi:cytochrome bd ubiquinol oxidase subunit II
MNEFYDPVALSRMQFAVTTLFHMLWPLLSIGLGLGLYPFLVPPSITIESAASSPKTLIFMIFGIGLLIPVMLLYNLYMYRVFHGIVEETEEY